MAIVYAYVWARVSPQLSGHIQIDLANRDVLTWCAREPSEAECEWPMTDLDTTYSLFFIRRMEAWNSRAQETLPLLQLNLNLSENYKQERLTLSGAIIPRLRHRRESAKLT